MTLRPGVTLLGPNISKSQGKETPSPVQVLLSLLHAHLLETKPTKFVASVSSIFHIASHLLRLFTLSFLGKSRPCSRFPL